MISSAPDEYRLLEEFIVGNSELDQLERLLHPFNIFEAVGVTTQELRHSHFLAYLLNPRENHGLGDRLTRALLQSAFRDRTGTELPVSAVDLDLWDLSEIEVHREWNNIDIFLRDPTNKFAVIIENKIHSGEHTEQLRRYREQVERDHHGWQVVGIFLTPDGSPPTSDESYLSVGYETICSTLESFLTALGSTIGQDIRTVIQHYTQMLRRHVVENSEVVELCQRIYQRHRRALDLIYEHRPDLQAEIREFLESLIASTDDIEPDISSKGYVRFAYRPWDQTQLAHGSGWTASRRMLLFEFTNIPDRLTLNLIIGPGPEAVRRKLFDNWSTRPPFKPQSRTLNKFWNSVWRHPFLARQSYQEASLDELKPAITRIWDEFKDRHLPILAEAVRDEAWLWQPEPGSTAEQSPP